MWRVRVVQSEQHMICRLTASGGQGGPSKHGRNWQRKTAVSGSSPQLTLKKGAPGDQVCDLLCVQLASYLERGPLMWIMPLHLHVNQKSDYDDDYAPPPPLHKRLNISETVQIPTRKPYIFMFFYDKTHSITLAEKTPIRACLYWYHPVHFINCLISQKQFRFPPLYHTIGSAVAQW